MRPNRTISRDRWGASSTDSEDCSSLDDDPRVISLHMSSESGSATSLQKAYQGMIDLLDLDLQVVYVSARNEVSALKEDNSKERISSSEFAIPCLATVLFFNGNEETNYEIQNQNAAARKPNSFNKPDLLKNHIWNSTLGVLDFEKDVKNSRDLNDNDVEFSGLKTPSLDGKRHKNNDSSGRRSPFLRYDVILKESKEREKNVAIHEKNIGHAKDIFDLESAETALEARKQLETWPWEFHHRANTTKGISQCQSNAQDFYAYQPNQEVTRLYGDVIDTSKIARRKNVEALEEGHKDNFIRLLDSTTDELRNKTVVNGFDRKKTTISTEDYPLMAVREVHYGRQHLRYTLFVSDTTWTDQVEFYRLLLRRHEVTLRDDFCFFTVYSGGSTDIQFALKKLNAKQYPIPLSSTTMQFKVHNVGYLVPLLPHACKPLNDVRWQTQDHDGNLIVLQICPRQIDSDTSSSHCDKDSTPLEDTLTSPSEMDGKQSTDDEYSLERLDSFIEPELPHRMPLLKPALYTNPFGPPRFGRRITSSSPGSSSSNSPERRPKHLRAYTPMMFSYRRMEMESTCTLPSPRKTSTSTPTSCTSRSRFSESSDEPENTNFYRRAKFKKDVRRKSDGALPICKSAKDPTKAPKNKRKQKLAKKLESSDFDEEVEFYV